MNLCRS